MRLVETRRSLQEPRHAQRTGDGARSAGRPRARGQSLVEFSLILGPLMLLLLGIVQFGLIFNTYITLTNAAREAARSGTIYVYDRTLSKPQNDLVRNQTILTTLTSSMNLLSTTSPQFTTSGTWSQNGLTFTNGDITVTYVIPSSVTDNDPRTGEEVTVSAAYHQDLVIPLIASLLPRDTGGRLRLGAQVTMVIN
jgi:Flp pilus assembly protein TadG